jgi:hypothetical protein
MSDEKLLDSENRLVTSMGDAAVHYAQEIPDDYLRELKREKDESLLARGEYQRAASVPVAVIDQWMAQGFDFYNAPAKDILRKLNAEGLDAFITTKKKL